MAQYKVTAPDGGTYQVNAPDNATPNQIKSYVTTNYKSATPSIQSAPDKPAVTTPWGSKPNAFERGLMEEGLDVAQLAKKAGIGKVSSEELQRQKADLEKQGKGTGLPGWIGEELGSPSNYIAPPIIGKAIKTAAPIVKKAVAPLAKPAMDVINPIVGKVENLTKGLGNKVKPLSADALSKATTEMRKISSDLYKQAKNAGLVFTKEAGGLIQKAIGDRLGEIGDIDPDLHKGTVSALKKLNKKVQSGDITLQSLDNSRQILGEVAAKTENGRPTGDAVRARAAIKAIDDTINKLDAKHLKSGTPVAIQILNKGRQQWAKSARFDRIARLVRKADGDPNKVKKLLSDFLKNPEKMQQYGYSKEEIAAIDKASKHGMERIPQAIGQFGIDPTKKGSLVIPSLTELAASAGGYGGLGIPLIAAGTAARPIQKYMADKKTQQLIDFLSGLNNAQK